MPATTVAIAGITGKFGRQLAHHLLKYPEVKIRGYGRDPTKLPATLTSSDRVSVFQGEAFNKDSIRAFVQGSDVVVCTYLGDPNLMVEGQKVLIDTSEQENVPRYVASDWAIDYTKLKLGDLFPKDPQIHVKKYLESKDKIKGVHVLTGVFLEVLLNPVFGLWDPQGKQLNYWGTGREVWEATTYENAAEYTAAVCLDREAVGIQKCEYFRPFLSTAPLTNTCTILVVGDTFSTFEMAETFEQVYGIKTKLDSKGSLDQLWTHMHQVKDKNPGNMFASMFL